MRKPKGHIRKRPFGYEIAVPEGQDPITKRYLYRYEYAHSMEEAEAARERMLADMAKGRQPRNEATFGQLLDAAAEVAHLDLSTRVTYQGTPSAPSGPRSAAIRADTWSSTPNSWTACTPR